MELLLWLSVYFGEDFIEPSPSVDTRYSNNRGEFKLDIKNLKVFLKAAEKMPSKSYPLWKKRLFDNVVTYYSVALRSGVNMMPLTMGFFGMSMECVGNLLCGKSDKYYTLGTYKFNTLINARFKRYKKNPNHAGRIKRWQKFINGDTALVHALRNAFYGHSLLHLNKDRKEITDSLRDWLVRAGYSKKDAAQCIKRKRVEDTIQVYAAPLYKVGLRSSRMLIFMLLGFTTSIPLAEYDYWAMTPLRYDEPMRFNGLEITPKSSTESVSVSVENVT
ncbi:hypothetical protein CRX57_08585 [Pseudomonas putida]|uniref:Uncharacterized protein n=2 Tax=Pseudomonas putida TaxID=303 RepID=A0A2C5W5D1_PSEPU|nr:hypothetical protein CRX57_08585 [Pseudomonas putida]